MKSLHYHLLWISACHIARVIGQEMVIPVGVENRDTVTMIRTQDNLGNYDVGYNENLLTGGASFHREKGFANGTRQGSYGYTTRNGLIRIVTYVADQDGYRAELLTNEPGTSDSNPSNVTVTKEKEPDAEALARGPLGLQTPQNAMAPSSSDVVKDYVMTSASSASGYVNPNAVTNSGSARVLVAAPYGQYQYFV